jgi:hypothetical protein
LQAAPKADTLSDEDIASGLEFRRDLVEGLKNPTFEDKRRALELL